MATRLSLPLLLILGLFSVANAALAAEGGAVREQRIAYYQYIAGLHHWLGIPPAVVEETRLELQLEARDLVPINRNVHGRSQSLAPEAAMAWQRLRRAARDAEIEFVVISSFRSVEYQARMVRRHLDGGRIPERLFRAVALPGYSEHHTGCAVDLASDDHPRLAHEFEDSPAYAWLRGNAAEFGFRESYPRGNRRGIMPEPWHWFYEPCQVVIDRVAR